MEEKHPHPHESELEREFELERMVLFSDAIFAIAITLMIIDVKWPDLPADMKGIDLGRLLRPTILRLAVFVISFFVVGRAWKVHLRLFRQLKTYNQGLLNLNLFFLLFIVVFPFSASGMYEHSREGFVFPYLFYMFNVSAVALTDFLMAYYILRRKPQLSIRGQEEEKKFILIRAEYNAIASLLPFILMVLIAIIFPGNTQYLTYAFGAYAIGLSVSNRRVRKFKPKTTN
jgi:uncharacterized membrane protein